ncbi:MAG: alpha/beta fold hydrolase [Acidimicrobiaceae bacterium]|nr:alpha/beta fold hydrolase [Acidimicrobiaceae bacterium]
MSVSVTPVDATGPLVVLFHGRGSDEKEIIALARSLPEQFEYVALRAPITEGTGFAWFANRGIGRPLAESLAETMEWFDTWLANVASPERPVVLVGFSGGAAFAGGLVLARPSRYFGAAILMGTMPFDAGLPTNPMQLQDVAVLVVHAQNDQVIPTELLERTWNYLHTESGASVTSLKSPGGHGIGPETIEVLRTWLVGIGDGARSGR